MTTETTAPTLPPLTAARRNTVKEWHARSTWVLPERFTKWSAKAGQPLSLELRTNKTRYGRLQSVLSAYTVDGGGEITRIFHDYFAVLQADPARVTEKTLLAQHNKWLMEVQAKWAQELEVIARHYAKAGEH